MDEEEELQFVRRQGYKAFQIGFEFQGTETHQFNQIGNAVAPNFAFHLAKNIKAHLMGTSTEDYPVIEFEQLKLFENEAVYQFR